MKTRRTIQIAGMFSALLLASANSFGQHDMHNMKPERDTMSHGHMQHDSMSMSSAFSPNLPMTRDGSGTSWQPDASPILGYMKMIGKDDHGMTSLMVHGNIFLRYTAQDITNETDNRGGSAFDAPNWIMAMLTHRHTKDVFSFITMFSLDPLTEGGSGYPLLFQTGESWEGKPLVDRQHPHDLFSQLAFNYTHAFSQKVDLNAFIGYPGEPALGPNVFMHRASAMFNPDAPLGHHWQDATHITFGVATLGFRYGKFKLEGSAFTGREPNEERYDFDKPRFDSYSGRLSVNPNANWSFQVSRGFIKSPEALKPDVDVNRTTASATYSRPLAVNKAFHATGVWGLNDGHSIENSALLEAALILNRLTVYSRYEWVEKSSEELNLQQFVNGEMPAFPINSLTAGLSYSVIRTKAFNMDIGAQGIYFSSDSRLNSIYGKNPMSAEIYLKISPASI